MAEGKFIGAISPIVGTRVIAKVDLKTGRVTMVNIDGNVVNGTSRDVTPSANNGQPENNLLMGPEKDANIKG